MVTKLMPLDILFLALPRADASAACLLVGWHFPRVLGMVVLAELAEPLDLPSSRRCKPVGVGGINGLRCLDVVRLRVPAPPGGQGKSYIIASTGAGIDQALYQRFLDSFTLTY